MSLTTGGKLYELECTVLDCPIFYMGVEWDAKIYERFCQYSVNGVKGWGISEWDYRWVKCVCVHACVGKGL